jgi:hypothetical protein
MLTNTFCHIPGIGISTEVKLWNAGIYNWDMFHGETHIPLSKRKVEATSLLLAESKDHLIHKNPLVVTFQSISTGGYSRNSVIRWPISILKRQGWKTGATKSQPLPCMTAKRFIPMSTDETLMTLPMILNNIRSSSPIMEDALTFLLSSIMSGYS